MNTSFWPGLPSCSPCQRECEPAGFPPLTIWWGPPPRQGSAGGRSVLFLPALYMLLQPGVHCCCLGRTLDGKMHKTSDRGGWTHTAWLHPQRQKVRILSRLCKNLPANTKKTSWLPPSGVQWIFLISSTSVIWCYRKENVLIDSWNSVLCVLVFSLVVSVWTPTSKNISSATLQGL